MKSTHSSHLKQGTKKSTVQDLSVGTVNVTKYCLNVAWAFYFYDLDEQLSSESTFEIVE